MIRQRRLASAAVAAFIAAWAMSALAFGPAVLADRWAVGMTGLLPWMISWQSATSWRTWSGFEKDRKGSRGKWAQAAGTTRSGKTGRIIFSAQSVPLHATRSSVISQGFSVAARRFCTAAA